MSGIDFLPVPVRIRGTDYPSMTAAARAHSVSVQAIACALDAGTLNTLGEAARPPVPCRIHGVLYPNMADAARKLSIPRDTLRYRIIRNVPGYERLSP